MLGFVIKAFGLLWPYVREMFVDATRSKKKKTRQPPVWVKTALAAIGLASFLACPVLGWELYRAKRSQQEIKPCPVCAAPVPLEPASAASAPDPQVEPTVCPAAEVRPKARLRRDRPQGPDLQALQSEVNRDPS